METVSQGTFEYIYDVCPIKKFSGGGVIGNNLIGRFKFLVVNDKSYFFGRIGGDIFGIRFLVYIHLPYDYYKIGFCSIGLLIVYS